MRAQFKCPCSNYFSISSQSKVGFPPLLYFFNHNTLLFLFVVLCTIYIITGFSVSTNFPHSALSLMKAEALVCSSVNAWVSSKMPSRTFCFWELKKGQVYIIACAKALWWEETSSTGWKRSLWLEWEIHTLRWD